MSVIAAFCTVKQTNIKKKKSFYITYQTKAHTLRLGHTHYM